MELPQASLGHHWQDSTHIANNVVTAGVTYRKVRIEVAKSNEGIALVFAAHAAF
jgi:hypothetical protein